MSQVQIVDEDVFISLQANAHSKDMNPSLLSPITSKI